MLQRGAALLLALTLSGCLNGPAVDLAPDYQPVQFVVPDSWHGDSPFVEAKPSDGELRTDWWTLYDDPVLNGLEEQAMAANPDLQAAAERFVQARDMMMKARSQLLPQIGVAFNASDHKQSANSLIRGAGEPNQDSSVYTGGIASWEPDFWSAIRNRTRAQIYRAEELAADFGLARLSLQAEIATAYFELRGYDALDAMYRQSIDYYKKSLEIVEGQFRGAIASDIDVARAKFLLSSTEAKELDIRSNRGVTEHALAILVNRVPAGFHIAPVDTLRLPHFIVPRKIPSTLLERRPDIAAMERRMAEANREIGIARAAFYPDISFRFDGGAEDNGFNLFKLANAFWSYGSSVALPVFQGGLRRAQLQQSWSVYRETEDRYRSTVLNAFREVENGLTQTKLMAAESKRQDEAVEAALKAQDLTFELYKGGLSSSLELINTQLNLRTAHIDALTIKIGLLKASVALVRALGGGWNRGQLPADDRIQPFDIFQYAKLDKPVAAGGIDVSETHNGVDNDLTKPVILDSSVGR